MINRSFIFIALSLFAIVSYALDSKEVSEKVKQYEGAPFVVENTVVHKISSDIVTDQVYEVRVALPASYQNSPDKKYPLVVVLDGQWNFTIVKDIVGKLVYDGMMPEAIVAAITWGGEGDDPNVLRARDMVRPVHPYIPLSGGGESFLSSLTDELIPFVETMYRITDKRVLMGASLGGLFTSYAMVEKPGYFDGHIAVAGSYFIDIEYLSEKLTSMSQSKALKNVRSYLVVGSLDANLVPVEGFNNAIEAADLKGFRHRHQVINGTGHAGVEPIAYTRGLMYVFKRPFLKLSEEFLQRYAGNYEGGVEGFPPFPITVEVAGEGTLTIGDGFQSNEYRADSETTFYLNGVNVTVEFVQDDEFIVNSQGSILRFTRVQN